MNRPKESDVQRSVIGYLKLLGLPFMRNNTGSAMMEIGKTGRKMPVRFGSPGWPDIITIYKGRFVGIECKRPLGPHGGTGGSDQTPEQRAVQSQIERAGGVYVLARSVQDVQRALKEV